MDMQRLAAAIEALDKARNELLALNNEATPLQSMVLIPLIGEVAQGHTKACLLREAMRDPA